MIEYKEKHMKEEVFQAFSHPCRREIIRMLRRESMSAGEIADHFAIAQPSVSRHLEVLRRTGVVSVKKKGTQMIYSLELQILQDMLLYISNLLVGKQEGEGQIG